jgi:hypothetical protein
MNFLKRIAKRLPYPLFLRLFYLRDRWTVRRQSAAVGRRNGVPQGTAASLAALKQSDTLVILGGGSSINAIPESFWTAARRCDTAGLNFWLYHPFIPTMYFYEAARSGVYAATWKPFAEIARERAADYACVPKFATELHYSYRDHDSPFPPEWQGGVQWLPTVPVPARTAGEFAQGLALLRREGVFDLRSDLCFKQLMSLTLALGVAAKLAYRRVLLCGIDLTSAEYFYQDAQRYPRWHDVRFLEPSKPHPLAVPLEWRIPVQDVLREMRRLLFTPAGAEIYVQNESSALYPEVPVLPADFFADASARHSV